MMKPFLLTLSICALVLAASTSVHAQEYTRNSGRLRIEAHGTLSTHEGLGGGVRAEFVILPNGAIPNFNDDFSLTAGAEAILFFDDDDHHGRWDHDHDNEGLGIWPMIALQWNFYLSKEWSVFPELGVWLQLGEDGHGHDDNNINMDLLFGVGARYHFGDRTAVFIRLEHPFMLHVGMQF